MSEKKSFWKVLNTPVQDLFKKEEEAAAQAKAAAEVAAPVSEPVSPEPVSPEPVAEETVPAVEILEETPIEKTPVAAAEPLAAEASVEELPVEEAPLADAVATEAVKAEATSAETEAEKAKRKKTLWEVLNTPVQDLFTEEGFTTDGEMGESYARVLGLGRDKSDLTETEKAPWLERFRSRLARTRTEFADSIERLTRGRSKVDEDMLEELEEILLQSDVGLDTTDDILEHLRQKAKSERFLPEEVLPALTAYLEETLESEPFRIEEGKLNIFLVVGVNGTGKTTTVGKIAAKLKLSGYRVMLAAGDTFRAAAIDQLAVWGTRANCPVISHHEGADAAAVVFDSIQSARAKKMDVLLIDTAGRLHNKDHLMEELSKVHRIVEREKKEDRVERILVLDATTGQNGLKQAEVFSKSVPLDSLILTKLDGTAKGGVIFAIKKQLNIPIKLLGVGEALGDLQEFEPKAFVEALFAQDDTMEGAALETESPVEAS